jgi:hypothetical protein
MRTLAHCYLFEFERGDSSKPLFVVEILPGSVMMVLIGVAVTLCASIFYLAFSLSSHAVGMQPKKWQNPNHGGRNRGFA